MTQWHKERQHWDTEPSYRFHHPQTHTSSTVKKNKPKNPTINDASSSRAPVHMSQGRRGRTVPPPYLGPLEGQERAGVRKNSGKALRSVTVEALGGGSHALAGLL